MVRLIGDVMADRGSCDYLTLKLLAKLADSGVQVEILLSNHDYEFIMNCERIHQEEETKRLQETAPDDVEMPCFGSVLGHIQTASMYKLNTILTSETSTFAEIWQLYHAAYKPTLKAVSYSIDEEKNAITIYTHAPTDLSTIENLAKKMNVPYHADTIQALAMTIDAINVEFKEYVDNNMVNTLFNDDAIRFFLNREVNEAFKIEYYPVEQLTNNRACDKLNRPEKASHPSRRSDLW
jgi:hypothetical protein